jgi:hypothetical protein
MNDSRDRVLIVFTIFVACVLGWAPACMHPVARTALDAARAACELFGDEAPPETIGMSLDECAEHLLIGQKTAAARK